MGIFARQRPPQGLMLADKTGKNMLRKSSRPVGKSLTAAGQRVRHGEGNTVRRLIQPWQTRAFAYYDLCGEIKYAAQFYSRALSSLDLFAGERNQDGELVPTTNQDAIDALERIQDPSGGRSGLLAQYGRLMFLTGEAYLFVTTDPDTGIESWEMLSTDEVRVMDGVIVRYKAPSLIAEDFYEADDDDYSPEAVVDPKTAVIYRIHRRHPRYSALADSTMQGVLDLCEELVLLTQAIRARARSRLAGSGILFLANEFSFPPVEPVDDADPEEDQFLSRLTEAMTTPIVDEGSASAVVPLVVRGSTEAIDKGVKHLQIIDPTQIYPESGLRTECIHRIAIGLDMPPEILEGLQDSNHWSAWQVDEQTWKAHLQPISQAFCDDITSAYFRPLLRQEGLPDWQRFEIGYDASKVINHPDRTKDAKDLFAAGELSGEALREASGFDEAHAPSEEERNRFLGIKIRDSSLAVYGIPSVKPGGLEPEAGEIVGGPDGGAVDPAGAGAAPEVVKAPPTPPNEEPVPGSVVGAAVARVQGAADLGVLRARELAGNRVRGYAKRDSVVYKSIEGVAAREIPAFLGGEKVRALGAPTAADLVEGARSLVVDAIRLGGVNGDVGKQIAEKVIQHAARTLFDPKPAPLPDAFGNYVAGLLLSAGRQG